VTVNWIAPNSRSSFDWIGIYQPGAPDNHFLAWQWIVPGTSGTNTFTMPSVPGVYEFRYYPDNSYNLAATSNPVTVGGGETVLTIVVPPPAEDKSDSD
jgi:hypothetical protein